MDGLLGLSHSGGGGGGGRLNPDGGRAYLHMGSIDYQGLGWGFLGQILDFSN